MPEPTPDAWAQIRYDYEHTDRPIVEICLEHGFAANTLRLRARRWGWTMRRTRIPAEGPPAMMAPILRVDADRPASPLPLEEVGEQQRCEPGESLQFEGVRSPHPPLPEGEREHTEFAAPDEIHEPSPHLATPTVVDAAPIGQRLQGAVARVLPAIEVTLAKLASGPMRVREMEQAARALGSLTRTLRELNALLAQHKADAPQRNTEDLRRDLARKLEAIIAERDAEMPRRYLAGWEEFAAGTKQQAAEPVL